MQLTALRVWNFTNRETIHFVRYFATRGRRIVGSNRRKRRDDDDGGEYDDSRSSYGKISSGSKRRERDEFQEEDMREPTPEELGLDEERDEYERERNLGPYQLDQARLEHQLQQQQQKEIKQEIKKPHPYGYEGDSREDIDLEDIDGYRKMFPHLIPTQKDAKTILKEDEEERRAFLEKGEGGEVKEVDYSALSTSDKEWILDKDLLQDGPFVLWGIEKYRDGKEFTKEQKIIMECYNLGDLSTWSFRPDIKVDKRRTSVEKYHRVWHETVEKIKQEYAAKEIALKEGQQLPKKKSFKIRKRTSSITRNWSSCYRKNFKFLKRSQIRKTYR